MFILRARSERFTLSLIGFTRGTVTSILSSSDIFGVNKNPDCKMEIFRDSIRFQLRSVPSRRAKREPLTQRRNQKIESWVSRSRFLLTLGRRTSDLISASGHVFNFSLFLHGDTKGWLAPALA